MKLGVHLHEAGCARRPLTVSSTVRRSLDGIPEGDRLPSLGVMCFEAGRAHSWHTHCRQFTSFQRCSASQRCIALVQGQSHICHGF